MKRIITLICMIVLAGQAHAADRVNEMESQPGESKIAFLERVGTFLYGWTYSNGDEACGMIAELDGAYSVILTTSRSQIMCESSLIYHGWNSTGETIHSHPLTSASGRIILTARTKELAGGKLDGRSYIKADRFAFSPGDYTTGPGYLVDNGKLLYQNGVGTSRTVGEVRNLAAGL